jgi:hypothetical protein
LCWPGDDSSEGLKHVAEVVLFNIRQKIVF